MIFKRKAFDMISSTYIHCMHGLYKLQLAFVLFNINLLIYKFG